MDNNNHIDLNRYLKNISYLTRISKEKEDELLETITNNPDEKAKDKASKELVEAHLFLVVDLAIKKARHGLDVMDLIYVGNLALLNAVNSYSKSHESHANFCTCAYTFITNAMANLGRNRLVYLPKMFDSYEIIIREFEVKNQKEASTDDIVTLLNVTPSRAREIRAGLDVKVASTESLGLDGNSWEDLYGEKDLSLDKRILSLDLNKFIKKLSPIQREVLELLYLNEGLDIGEASKRLGCSKQYVEAMCKNAMREIKSHLIKAWDKEHNTRTVLMSSKRVSDIRKKNGKILKALIRAEEDINKKTYKKVIEHYLGR